MYKILYVNESKMAMDCFMDFIELNDSEGIFEVVAIFPERTFSEMIHKVLFTKADIVIVDTILNDCKEDIDYNVGYNGVHIVKSICNLVPCFLQSPYLNKNEKYEWGELRYINKFDEKTFDMIEQEVKGKV